MEKNSENQELKKELKNRHIQMIAIGSAIGVGLFYGSASAIKTAGPSLLLSYLVGGIFVLFIMRALGELAVDEPSSGSFATYANRYYGRFAGFFIGWTYWFEMILIIMAEASAIGVYIQYWAPTFPKWLTALIVIVVLLIVNMLGVKYYGECEFWFSMVKVLAIICMIVFGSLMVFGGFANGGHAIGISNLWKNGGFFPNGLKGFLLSFTAVAFAFSGVELVGITAAETENPKKSIPAAINSIFWRVLIFYIGALFVMLSIYPWNEIGVNGSPFVLVFAKVGIPAAASIINFVVLTAAFSSMNSDLYVSGRILYSMALENNAPKSFAKVSKSGVPYVGVLTSCELATIAVILNYLFPSKVFEYIMSISTIAVLITWAAIVCTQIRSRNQKMAEGDENKLSFKMPFYPFSSYITLVYIVVIGISLAFSSSTRVALIAGPIWLIFVAVLYKFITKGESKEKVIKV